MKKGIITGAIVLTVGLLTPQIIVAQGTTTFLSNLEQPSAGGSGVGSDSWAAALFYTGDNVGGYMLNSVQLAMTDASGSPSGFSVMIYANSGNPIGASPGNSLGTLTGSGNPATGGVYTYTAASDISLSGRTAYFIVLTSSTTIANGAYEWSYTSAVSYNPSGGWLSQGGVLTSSNGSSWPQFTPVAAQFAITATPAPEPGVLGLFALGGLLVAFQRRKAGA